MLLYARCRGAKRELRILSIALMIAAAIYPGFALIWGNAAWIAIEIAGVATFGLFVWLAMQYSPIWLAVGWGIHPAWDVGLHLFGLGYRIAPEWYVVACISFDLLVAGYILIYMRSMKKQQVRA